MLCVHCVFCEIGVLNEVDLPLLCDGRIVLFRTMVLLLLVVSVLAVGCMCVCVRQMRSKHARVECVSVAVLTGCIAVVCLRYSCVFSA